MEQAWRASQLHFGFGRPLEAFVMLKLLRSRQRAKNGLARSTSLGLPGPALTPPSRASSTSIRSRFRKSATIPEPCFNASACQASRHSSS